MLQITNEIAKMLKLGTVVTNIEGPGLQPAQLAPGNRYVLEGVQVNPYKWKDGSDHEYVLLRLKGHMASYNCKRFAVDIFTLADTVLANLQEP